MTKKQAKCYEDLETLENPQTYINELAEVLQAQRQADNELKSSHYYQLINRS